MEHKEVSVWLYVVLWGIVFAVVINDIISRQSSVYELGGKSVILLVMFFTARQCSKWAYKINKSMNLAYSVGFLFSLLGLIGYAIYYNSIKGKTNE